MTWPKLPSAHYPDPRPLTPEELQTLADQLPLAWEDNPGVRLLWRRLQMEWTRVWRQIRASPESTAHLNNLLGQLAALEFALQLPETLLDEAHALEDAGSARAQSHGE